MTGSKLSPKQIEALFLQIRAMSDYLGLLRRRLIDRKLVAVEPELFDYLTDAYETVAYLCAYLHDSHLRSSGGGWDRPFEKMMRPVRKLKRLK